MKTVIELIELEDVLADQVINSFCERYGYGNTGINGTGVPEKRTKQEFLQEKILERLFEDVKQHESSKDAEVAKRAKEVQLDSTLKDQLIQVKEVKP